MPTHWYHVLLFRDIIPLWFCHYLFPRNISWSMNFTYHFAWICRFYPHARMRTPTSMFHPLRSSFWFHLQQVHQLDGNSQKKTNPWWTTTYSQQWPRSLLVRVFVYILRVCPRFCLHFYERAHLQLEFSWWSSQIESRAGWRFLRQRQ